MDNLPDSKIYLPFSFTYHPVLRFLFGVGIVFFFTSGVLSYRVVLLSGLEIIYPLLFLAAGILNTYLFFIHTGTVVISAEEVIYIKFRKTIRILFRDIRKIENQLFNARLAIHSDNKKIVVEKQIQNYEYFYFLLMERVPIILHASQLQLPVLVKVRVILYIFAAVLSGLGGVFTFLSIRDRVDIGTYIFSLGLLGIGLIFFVRAPRSYYFDSIGIRVKYPLHKKEFRWIDLKMMDLVKMGTGVAQDRSMLKFEFANGALQISELLADQPLEELLKAILQVLKRYERGDRSGEQDLLE